jgi:hypothetical protein
MIPLTRPCEQSSARHVFLIHGRPVLFEALDSKISERGCSPNRFHYMSGAPDGIAGDGAIAALEIGQGNGKWPGAFGPLGRGRLHATAVAKQKRRGRKPAVSIQTSDNPRTEAATVHLTPGKMNAVRAAFKAGVKPSQIARQFSLSQSDVRKALASALR